MSSQHPMTQSIPVTSDRLPAECYKQMCFLVATLMSFGITVDTVFILAVTVWQWSRSLSLPMASRAQRPIVMLHSLYGIK